MTTESYYVTFLNGDRVTVLADSKNNAADAATLEAHGDHDRADIYHIYKVSQCGPCIYCGDITHDLICERGDGCQREHFGMS